jgi:hypothetical protein
MTWRPFSERCCHSCRPRNAQVSGDHLRDLPAPSGGIVCHTILPLSLLNGGVIDVFLWLPTEMVEPQLEACRLLGVALDHHLDDCVDAVLCRWKASLNATEAVDQTDTQSLRKSTGCKCRINLDRHYAQQYIYVGLVYFCFT